MHATIASLTKYHAMSINKFNHPAVIPTFLLIHL